MTAEPRWQAEIRLHRGGVNLDVSLGGGVSPVALIGPNGGGKTTLLKVIAGVCPAERAELHVNGQCLQSSARGIALPCEARSIGYVPQGYGLFPHLTVGENVGFGLSTRSFRWSAERRRRAVVELLNQLQCATLIDRRPAELSGGERQRVALARALILAPKLLLLDEPMAALDVSVRRKVRGVLSERLAKAGQPTLVVTHDVRDVAALGATVCVLEAGRIVQQGSLEQLRQQPATDFVAEFVGEQPLPR